MTNNSLDLQTVVSAIKKFIKLQENIDVKTERAITQLNSVQSGSGAIVARGSGSFNTNQKNQLESTMSTILYYENLEKSNLSDDELFIITSIADFNKDSDKFYSDEYLLSLLNYPIGTDLEIDVEKEVLIVTLTTGETEIVPFNKLAEELGKDYISNKAKYERAFIDNFRRNEINLETALSVAQVNSIIIQDASIIDNEFSASQTNKACIDIQNRLQKIYDGKTNVNTNNENNTDVEKDANENNIQKDSLEQTPEDNNIIENDSEIIPENNNIPEKEIQQQVSNQTTEKTNSKWKIIKIIVIVISIIIVTIVLFLVFLRPQAQMTLESLSSIKNNENLSQ